MLFDTPSPYNTIQNVILIAMAIYILSVNILAIAITFYWKCPVQRMLISSQTANIIATCSLFTNEIYYSQVIAQHFFPHLVRWAPL